MTDAIRNISTQTNNNIIKQDEVQKKPEGDTPLPKELSHAKGVSVKSTVLLVGLSLVTCGAAAVLYCAMAGGYSFFNYVKSMYSEVDSMLDSLKEENQVAKKREKPQHPADFKDKIGFSHSVSSPKAYHDKKCSKVFPAMLTGMTNLKGAESLHKYLETKLPDGFMTEVDGVIKDFVNKIGKDAAVKIINNCLDAEDKKITVEECDNPEVGILMCLGKSFGKDLYNEIESLSYKDTIEAIADKLNDLGNKHADLIPNDKLVNDKLVSA